jgi:H+/Cl- antiporter ClcA
VTSEPEPNVKFTEQQGSLIVLALASLIVGVASGLLGAVFRLALEQADRFRDAVLTWAYGKELAGLLLILGFSATATGLAAWLVRRHSPEASGSGIPHVEAVLHGELPPASFRLLPVKFVGGLLAWFAPGLIGGGDAITQGILAGTEALAMVSVVFILRFGLGAVSYAAGTPGGLFAPMLVLGSQSGLLFGTLCNRWFPSIASHPTAFAVVGMAAFFTAVVRAPVTGIVLVTEMTSSVTLLLPMLASCFVAMLVPTLLDNAPIYETLRQCALQR